MAASERIKLDGKSLKPIVGDLVYEKNKVIKLDSTNLSEYKIEDVLLPLPGHNILYPNNESKEIAC